MNNYEFSQGPWDNPPEQGYYQAMPKPPKKKSAGKGVVAIAVILSFLAGAAGAGGVLLAERLLEQEEPVQEENITFFQEGSREPAKVETVIVETGREMTPAQVYEANVNATVGITTSVTTNYWGYRTTSAASGSGFIISSDGYILTNYHVIEDSDSISVSLYDGSVYEAALIGYDESNDIAVLKIDGENLKAVVLGDSDDLRGGDQVLAIGNPLGELTFSLTAGLVSAKDRTVTMSGDMTMNLLQTDCAINSGNSGGALFNLYGEVVGVTNAKYSSSGSQASIDNIGFAIPINSIRSIVESIIEKGYIAYPYIGITVADVSQQTQIYGIPAGAAVQAVTEDGPAEQAGLRAGDVITSVDGTTMTSAELVDYVGKAQIGAQMVLHIYRKGETLEITVTVGEQIRSAKAESTQQVPMVPGFR